MSAQREYNTIRTRNWLHPYNHMYFPTRPINHLNVSEMTENQVEGLVAAKVVQVQELGSSVRSLLNLIIQGAVARFILSTGCWD